jgi:hypothetical protein
MHEVGRKHEVSCVCNWGNHFESFTPMFIVEMFDSALARCLFWCSWLTISFVDGYLGCACHITEIEVRYTHMIMTWYVFVLKPNSTFSCVKIRLTYVAFVPFICVAVFRKILGSKCNSIHSIAIRYVSHLWCVCHSVYKLVFVTEYLMCVCLRAGYWRNW